MSKTIEKPIEPDFDHAQARPFGDKIKFQKTLADKVILSAGLGLGINTIVKASWTFNFINWFNASLIAVMPMS
jgi:hypothetical protein